MFLPVNEFDFHLNPLKPGKIVLELSKKSKRNLRLRQAGYLALSLLPLLTLIPAVEDKFEEVADKLDEKFNDTPDES